MSGDERLRLACLGLHPDRRAALVDRWGSAGRVLAAIGAGRVRASEAVRRAASLSATECRRRLDSVGVRAVLRGDEQFPEWLGCLPESPDVLFLRGALPAVPGVAIVGTRRCTRYGRSLAGAYGRIAAESGWPVVSGLARGIDGEAHRGMLGGGGIGVAVLGSGPDVIYPPEHRDLHDALVHGGGAVVTEYPPGTPPEPWRFPPRNRVISGLAGAVVVVEAAETGGALITAGFAAEQGRTVFAVPGDVGRASSTGCNLLIRDGAIPVLTPDDFAEAIALVLGPPTRARPAARCGTGPDDQLLRALGPTGLGLEEAAAVWGLAAPDAAAAATRLEMAGRARWDGGVLVPTGR